MRKNVRKGMILILLCSFGCMLTGCDTAEKAVSAPTEQAAAESTAKSYKRIRSEMRAAEKAQLNEIAHGADAELAHMAQEQLIGICLRDEQETTCEAVLEMRGFSEPVVTVHETSVNVVLNGSEITAQESAVIMELICRETGAAPENIKIIPTN